MILFVFAAAGDATATNPDSQKLVGIRLADPPEDAIVEFKSDGTAAIYMHQRQAGDRNPIPARWILTDDGFLVTITSGPAGLSLSPQD